jgi:hypothetical protein
MGNPIAYAKICATSNRIAARTPMLYGARRIHGNELRICCRQEERLHCLLQQVIREAQATFTLQHSGQIDYGISRISFTEYAQLQRDQSTMITYAIGRYCARVDVAAPFP